LRMREGAVNPRLFMPGTGGPLRSQVRSSHTNELAHSGNPSCRRVLTAYGCQQRSILVRGALRPRCQVSLRVLPETREARLERQRCWASACHLPVSGRRARVEDHQPCDSTRPALTSSFRQTPGPAPPTKSFTLSRGRVAASSVTNAPAFSNFRRSRRAPTFAPAPDG